MKKGSLYRNRVDDMLTKNGTVELLSYPEPIIQSSPGMARTIEGMPMGTRLHSTGHSSTFRLAVAQSSMILLLSARHSRQTCRGNTAFG